jgi:hypothetical protein
MGAPDGIGNIKGKKLLQNWAAAVITAMIDLAVFLYQQRRADY